MGLWSNLFKRAAHDDGALLSPGKSYHGKEIDFPNLGQSMLVSNDEALSLSSIVGVGKPTVALIYSNC
jgi:hypothetical protein